MTGEVIDGATAIALGLADTFVDAAQLEDAWQALAALDFTQKAALDEWIATFSIAACAGSMGAAALIDQVFSMASVGAMLASLEASSDEWAQKTAAQLRKRSPLMLHVVLEQIRRARTMTLAEDLRMERNLVRHCFTTAHLGRSGVRSETVEGIRALAVDKDHSPQWSPLRVEDVTPDMVAPFFVSPWAAQDHPLAGL